MTSPDIGKVGLGRAPAPANEPVRLAFLRNLKLDPSLPHEEIQGLCEVASKLADAPIALVSLINERKQNFLASVGIGDMRQTDREIAFCAHAIMDSQQFEVPDASLDPRFAKNPFVVDDPCVRSYLGTVLEPEADIRLGTLCVLDTKPQVYSSDVKAQLSQIGKAITALLVSHRDKLDLVKYSEEMRLRNSEMKELAASLRTSMERLVTAENSKSQFLTIMNHELRTPLTSIMGSLELMKSRDVITDKHKSERLISLASAGSKRLLSLIENVLHYQKLESGIFQTSLVPINLAQLIEASADAYRSSGAEVGVTLTVSGTEQTCIANGDKGQLNRVLANILSNAFKFSKRGGNVEISLRCFDEGAQIAIKDEGVGIPAGSEEKVFGVFSQVDSSDTRSQSGTGLGLSICRLLLQQHNATITYESELGVGTTFLVNFAPTDYHDNPSY